MRPTSITRSNGAHYFICRAAHPLVFQYSDARDDRHGAERYLTHVVNHSKENLLREFLQELYKFDMLKDLLKDSELVVARRKEVVSVVEALNKAEESILPPSVSALS